MKYIYKILKEIGTEEAIKEWRYYGVTVLMLAAMNGRPNVLKWLIHELKSDVNEQNIYGGSALHLATRNNQMECASVLLDLGSQLLKNEYGKTPLDCAIDAENKQMKNLLESHFLG